MILYISVLLEVQHTVKHVHREVTFYVKGSKMIIRRLFLIFYCWLFWVATSFAASGGTTANDAYMLGMSYQLSNDFEQAVYWYKNAAEQGHIQAQSSLGDIFLNGGEGVEPDAVEALRWHLSAAQLGDESSQVTVGMMYAEGFGTEQDYHNARHWFHEAASQGSAAGMFNLGIIHDYGYGVPIDRIAAFSWYKMAAGQGSADAQYNVGMMYARGEGIEQNAVEAYRWLNKAAEQGHPTAMAARAELEQILTPAQLSLARGEGELFNPNGPTITVPNFKSIAPLPQ